MWKVLTEENNIPLAHSDTSDETTSDGSYEDATSLVEVRREEERPSSSSGSDHGSEKRSPLLPEHSHMVQIWSSNHCKYKSFDSQCAICINKYKVGDQVVQSMAREGDSDEDDHRCPHLYHYRCMVMWLSDQGKKRCPVCRHWFVPGLSVPDQMKTAKMSVSGDHLIDSKGKTISSIEEFEKLEYSV